MYRKILIVVDDSTASQCAIEKGLETALAHRADVLFFNVLPRPEVFVPTYHAVGIGMNDEFQKHAKEHASRMLAAACDEAESQGVHSFRAMGSGIDEAGCVAKAATDHHCDLIVVGTRERSAILRLLTGSIVPGLISTATVPVMVCKDERRGRSHRRSRAAAVSVR